MATNYAFTELGESSQEPSRAWDKARAGRTLGSPAGECVTRGHTMFSHTTATVQKSKGPMRGVLEGFHPARILSKEQRRALQVSNHWDPYTNLQKQELVELGPPARESPTGCPFTLSQATECRRCSAPPGTLNSYSNSLPDHNPHTSWVPFLQA